MCRGLGRLSVEPAGLGNGEGLLQRADVGTEVDVIGCAIEDESGHRFNADEFRLSDARFVFSKVDHLDVEAARIECCGYVLFSSDADGAACVVECSFGFHMDVSLMFCGLNDMPLRYAAACRGHQNAGCEIAKEGTIAWAGTVLFPLSHLVKACYLSA